MNLTHKIRLYPNRQQTQALQRACGVARFTYNYALAQWKQEYEAGNKPTAMQLKKQFNAIKAEQFPWIYESPKDCNQQPFTNLNKAFQRFFKTKNGYPKFKKRGARDSFYISNDKASFVDKQIKLPLIGKVKLAEQPRFKGRIMSFVVSKDVDRWFVAVSYDLPQPSAKVQNTEVVGIDLGLTNFATLSDGTKIENPSFLHRLESKLKREQRRLAKKQKCSANRSKQRIRLAKTYRTIRNRRQDFLNKLTTLLAKTKQEIVIENLHVSGMLKNHRLAKSIANASWGEFRRQLEYKTKRFGSLLTVVDRFYPSSKICSICGFKADQLPLNIRAWTCPQCNNVLDRDSNAAVNLRNCSVQVGKAIPEFKPVEIVLAEKDVLKAQSSTLLLMKQEALSLEHLGSLNV